MGRVKSGASTCFYWAATYLLRAVLWFVGRWTVTGREHLPAEGGVIVVSNHLNNADPPIIGAAIARRRVRFMAKIELFRPPFSWVIRSYGAFPVRRFEADVGALLTAERHLRRGEIIGMFPEGTRSRTGKTGKPHPGTALIALRSGVPVVCCSLTGTEQLRNPLNLLRRPRITVRISPPLQFGPVKRPDPAAVQEVTHAIFGRILAELPEEYRGSYTGTTESEMAAIDAEDYPSD